MKRVIVAAEEKKYLSDEEKQEFLDNVNMEPLYNEIRKRTGISDLEFSDSIRTDRLGCPRMTFSSGNVADKCGILSLVMEEVVIDDFGSDVKVNEDGAYMYIYINFSWKFKEGGTNGHELFGAFCFGGNDWKFN